MAGRLLSRFCAWQTGVGDMICHIEYGFRQNEFSLYSESVPHTACHPIDEDPLLLVIRVSEFICCEMTQIHF